MLVLHAMVLNRSLISRPVDFYHYNHFLHLFLDVSSLPNDDTGYQVH